MKPLMNGFKPVNSYSLVESVLCVGRQKNSKNVSYDLIKCIWNWVNSDSIFEFDSEIVSKLIQNESNLESQYIEIRERELRTLI